MLFTRSFSLLALAASASAHMRLNWPVPYGANTLNNNPLAPGDFPCKQRPGVYEVTEMNQWNAGETQTVSFLGSVVHGGGSCQFSLTTDMKPTESTEWKVIHSIIGGCPSNVTGNLPNENPDGREAAVFPVTMPSDIPDGQYTMAWSWINKIGNREFYMNCAPIQVGNPSGSASTANVAAKLSAYPDMVVANLPATECATAEGEDFVYPDPGKSVAKGEKAKPGNTMTGSGCKAASKPGAGEGTPTQPEAPAQSSAVSEQPVAQPPAYSPAPIESAGPVYSAAPIGSDNSSKSDGVSAPGAPSSPAAPPSSPPTYGNVPTNSTPSSDGECTPCSNDGAVVCIGNRQFGICNRDCAVAQDLAAGMSCSDGVVVSSTKRSVRFPRAHLHRHLHRRHGMSRLLQSLH